MKRQHTPDPNAAEVPTVTDGAVVAAEVPTVIDGAVVVAVVPTVTDGAVVAAEVPTVIDGAVTVDLIVERNVDHEAFGTDERYTDALSSRPEPMSGKSSKGAVVFSRTNDRAAVVATVIMQICATTPELGRRQALEDYIRDEIADIQRQAIANHELADE